MPRKIAQTAAEAEKVVRRLRAEEARRKKLEAALEQAGARAEDARKARAAAIAEIGELLRQAAAGQPGGLIDWRMAQYLTGLSKPTLTEARDNPTAWDELVDLAKRARSHDEDAERELHARRPNLAGWLAAAMKLQEDHERAYWQERGGFDPSAPVDAEGDAPGYQTLIEDYEEQVRRLAEGRPV
ncbi:hypothetical protein [Plantactinospora sp. CA-290183]|uniref:hypothetical protein n=1 Tax=Plantactinospora sp. CA-290183 TaxID=3240006 RepID=UPI003D8E1776